MLNTNESEHTDVAPTESTGAVPGRFATARHFAVQKLGLARTWLRGFRRTRPFWGGLWMIVGGWLILRMSMVDLQIMMSAGLTGFGGWLSGGGLILCGLAAWLAPSQRFFAGLIGLLLAVASFVISNLGGFFIGMFFGIIGSAMALSWGATKARRRRVFSRREAAVDEGDAAETRESVA